MRYVAQGQHGAIQILVCEANISRVKHISLPNGKYRKSRKGFISQNKKSATLSGNRFCCFIRN